ncbi:MAG: carboxypeptidase-like regulatory domain-containing protein [Planctomycetes bacterium]|nr:carboxypeptidase-like regulatory domain-containing protein [Planctomycetota bacterium]
MRIVAFLVLVAAVGAAVIAIARFAAAPMAPPRVATEELEPHWPDPPLAAEAAPTGAVLGVVRRAGHPAAATVSLYSVPPGAGRLARIRAPCGDGTPRAVASAADDGRFAFDGLATGAFLVHATGEDGAAATATVAIECAGARAEVLLDLPAAAHVLRGRAVHADGTPFSALVAAAPDDGLDRPAMPFPGRRTDPAGRFEVCGLPAGATRVFFLVEDDGLFVSPVLRLPDPEERTFVVDASAADLTGRVLDAATRSPIGKATVLAEGDAYGGRFSRRVVTGADGRFRVRVPREGRELTAWAEGHAAGRLEVPAERDVIDVFLTPAAGVSGRVVSAADGRPVAGLRVLLDVLELTPDPIGLSTTALSDAGGRFRFPEAPPLRVWIGALGAGWATSACEELPASAGPREVTLRVGPAARAEVEVSDAAGAPITGAVVRACLRQVFRSCIADVSAVSDAAGIARFDSLPPRRPCLFTVRAPGRPAAEAIAWTGSPADVARVAIRMVRGRFVDVTVLATGPDRPLEGAVVRATFTHQGSGGGGEVSGRTGPEGRVRLGPLPPAELRISASHPDCLDLAAESHVADSEADGAAAITLTPGLAITGRVQRPDGRPARFGSVETPIGGPPFGRTLRVPIGEDGSFRMSPLAPGRVVLTASLREEGTEYTARGEFAAGAEGVEIALGTDPASRAGEFTILVLDPEGRPVPRARARVTDGTGREEWAEVVTAFAEVIDGEARLRFRERVPESVWYEVAEALDHSGAPLPLGVVAGGPVPFPGRVEVRLPAQLAISGRLIGPDGEATGGARIEAWGNEGVGGLHGDARSAADGGFRIAGLGDFRYRLNILAPPGFAHPDRVLARGGEDDLTIRLGIGDTLHVTVRDGEGRPIGNARVDPHHSACWLTTGPDGVAVIRGFAKGRRIDLEVSPPPDRPDLIPSVKRSVTPGAVEVTLRTALFIRGRVLDESGAPVTDRRVRIVSVSDDPTGEARCGPFPVCADGSFRIGPLPPCSVRIAVERRCSDYVYFAPRFWGEDDHRWATAGAQDVNLRYREGRTLTVRIAGWVPPGDRVGPAGHPAFLTMEPGDEETLGLVEEGLARFTDLPPDRTFTFFYQAAGGVAYLNGLRAGGGEVRAELAPGATVRGRILAPAGAREYSVAAAGPGFRVRGEVAADGSFRIANVPALPCAIEVGASAGGRRLEAAVTARPGVDVEIDLRDR